MPLFIINIGELIPELCAALPFSINDVSPRDLSLLIEDIAIRAIQIDQLLEVNAKDRFNNPNPEHWLLVNRLACNERLRQTLYVTLCPVAYSYGFHDWTITLVDFDKLILKK